MICCLTGNQKICDLLLNTGSQVNIMNSIGDTPMSIAQRKGFHEIVMKLAERGAKLKLSKTDLVKIGKTIK